MNKQDIQLLFDYNQWANARILNAASSLTDEQFLASASYPHGGLRGTLTHTLFAEWLWRKRWEGQSPTNGPMPEDFSTFESLKTLWVEEENKLMKFVASCSEEKLNSVIQYKSLKGAPFENVLWQMMTHVINHGTQHRSEAAAMLTDLNHSPGDIDMILFLRENKK